ncbi:uncharacterized protein MELLADRAFT_102780 [Melampsora larici-populina 98AG31]|uniref:Uncharacterized protein n=1 Tax=Melampsora larici-populina (strain 98AG31 / pathotype 3-4-7) TaxID=747676 RepID=F4R9C5_MELLP|nr:uncharacterized protein MELLADRAFT_102780 [Melampsora larici-populina 98AG31]EGG11181.1 hypothetical protein MELLADRAFT_102780 [Melampsora larici-populina 98AG31]
MYESRDILKTVAGLALAAKEGIKIIFPFINQISLFVKTSRKSSPFALNQQNTVNGRIYGLDDTFLCFETGNKMDWTELIFNDNSTTNDLRPAPANWTIDITQHIKLLAPNTLVMDGSYFQEHIEAFNRTFVVGEHGFYSLPAKYKEFNANFTGAGVSLTLTSFTCYHAPGWRNQTDEAFDQIEYNVVCGTYKASYKLLQDDVAPYPIPSYPYAFFATNGSTVGLSFKGAAWDEHYEIWAAGSDESNFVKVADDVLDNVGLGKLFVPIDPTQPTAPLKFHTEVLIRPIKDQSGWEDTKWKTGGSEQVHGTINPLREDYPLTAQSASQSIDCASLRRWYTGRGLSVDGYHGPFS